jgi:quinol monooxygenase YgiN
MTGTIVVTGWIRVDPEHRDAYVEGCRDVVRAARGTHGCVDFAITADTLDPARVVIVERWSDRAALDEFRGSGPDGEQQAAILEAAVDEYETASELRL